MVPFEFQLAKAETDAKIAELALDEIRSSGRAPLAQELELRRPYLGSQITAVEAELRLFEVDARKRVLLLQEKLEYFRLELDRLQEEMEAGAVHPVEATRMKTQVAELEGRLRLAQAELNIVQRELERKAVKR